MYLPAFLFGFALAGSPAAMAAIARLWKTGAAIALIGFATVVAVEYRWPGNVPAPRWVYPYYGAAHAFETMGRDRRADRHRRALVESRQADPRHADRGGIPVLHLPPDDYRRGNVLAAPRRATRLGGVRDPRRGDHRGMPRLLFRRSRDRAATPADRTAPTAQAPGRAPIGRPRSYDARRDAMGHS